MPLYVVEYMDKIGKWVRSSNAATEGVFSSYGAAQSALEDNPHFKSKTFEFRVRESAQEAGVVQNASTSKEDKMFQVTVYNFATGAVSNNAFDRLCAAQDNLEKQVAGFRSAVNGSNRVFFTASILDTKTGKYHGFVSDAPPPVELKTE